MFNDFYKENLCILTFATSCLSIPLIFRGILDLLVGDNITFREFTEYQRINYDAFIYIVGAVIPLGTQLSTLIFGHIRKRTNEKYRLKIIKEDTDEAHGNDSSDSDSGSLENENASASFNFFHPSLFLHR